jgi:hypothetical protein
MGEIVKRQLKEMLQKHLKQVNKTFKTTK